MAIGVWQLVVILALVLIIFGGRRLPELGQGLGLSLANFRKAVNGDDKSDSPDQEEAPDQLKDG
jgi:Sec-independent protein secretion pathway components